MNARVILPLLLCLSFHSCSEESTGKAVTSSNDAIYTTFYPTLWMTQLIVKGQVQVVCPLPPDEDPVFWMPDEETIREYQAAALIIINGAGFEKWVATSSLPESRIVDTTATLKGELITLEGVTHTHGPKGEHTHAGLDGHTWVDPRNAIIQATAIRDALTKRFPDSKASFVSGFTEVEAGLRALDLRLQELAPRASKTRFLSSHPAYNYLARRYGWNLLNQDIAPDKDPSEIDLEPFKKLAPFEGRTILLFESDPLESVKSKIQDLGIHCVTFEPGETSDDGLDYLSIMNANIDRLRAALES